MKENNMGDLFIEQWNKALPSRCKYCGKYVYWEVLKNKRKIPINMMDFSPHYCAKRPVTNGDTRRSYIE